MRAEPRKARIKQLNANTLHSSKRRVDHLHFPQYRLMDDLTEMFTMPTWPEVTTMNKLPWEFVNTLGPHYASHDNMMGAAHLSQQQAFCENLANSGLSSFLVDVNSGSFISRGMQEAVALDALRRLQEGSCRTSTSGKSASLPANSSCDMGSSISELQVSTPTWSQPYMEGMPSSSLGLGPAKAQAGLNEGMFVAICGPQAQQLRTHGQQVSHGLPANSHALSHTGQGQLPGATAGVTGAARPRVRARRGQATDPHSIAERLRRERIADRMKALQELVPNANKTDKASMLDEIIEYVRFLQLQVKILSMSRLGVNGRSAMVPLVADIPSEGLFDFAATLREGSVVCSSQENMIAIERQAARLMEESMGSALQYLQSKGVCLMPTSLASAMSTGNIRLQMTSSSHIVKTEASSTTNSIKPASNVVKPMTSLNIAGVDLIANEVSSGILSSRETQTQSIITVPFVKCGLKPFTDITKAGRLPS
ncbi:hypothetical protein L7F22_034021 [Adiantum nelumboides]|nr:hypothetical protein [Adiantum nelumboides]